MVTCPSPSLDPDSCDKADRFEIYNLIASHPPSADTGAGECIASVWTEDGVFDRGAEFARPTGPAAIAGERIAAL
jgi:hypothetical protein